jgi:hypothetical protein
MKYKISGKKYSLSCPAVTIMDCSALTVCHVIAGQSLRQQLNQQARM